MTQTWKKETAEAFVSDIRRIFDTQKNTWHAYTHASVWIQLECTRRKVEHVADFSQSISIFKTSPHVLHPATETQSRSRAACSHGKTTVSTGNLGLRFNLKEHRIRRWLHCTVILVFIASRDWWRCRSGGGGRSVHPASMDIGVRLVRPALYTPSRIISRRVRARGHGRQEKKAPAQYSDLLSSAVWYMGRTKRKQRSHLPGFLMHVLIHHRSLEMHRNTFSRW